MAQGLEAMEITPLPYANIILFTCSKLMAFGLIWVTAGVMKKEKLAL